LVHNQGGPLFSWIDEVNSGNFNKDQPVLRIDADPDSTYHPDVDPEPYPEPDPEPDPDHDPSFQIKAQTLEKC
jgi:hypothetical protein